jgi:hypothetical protein
MTAAEHLQPSTTRPPYCHGLPLHRLSVSTLLLLVCRRQMDAIRRLSQPTSSSPFEALLRMVRRLDCTLWRPMPAEANECDQNSAAESSCSAACVHVGMLLFSAAGTYCGTT